MFWDSFIASRRRFFPGLLSPASSVNSNGKKLRAYFGSYLKRVRQHMLGFFLASGTRRRGAFFLSTLRRLICPTGDALTGKFHQRSSTWTPSMPVGPSSSRVNDLCPWTTIQCQNFISSSKNSGWTSLPFRPSKTFWQFSAQNSITEYLWHELSRSRCTSLQMKRGNPAASLPTTRSYQVLHLKLFRFSGVRKGAFSPSSFTPGTRPTSSSTVTPKTMVEFFQKFSTKV